MLDAAIVGGGPVGCFFAEELARKGFDVGVIEEHEGIGRPMCCAGVVGTKGLREVGIDPENWSLEELEGATFYPPSKEPISLTRHETEAYVIDRANFDRAISERAARAGARFFLNSRCEDVSFKGDKVSLKVYPSFSKDETPRTKVDTKSIHARLVVGADGPTSIVGRKAGLASNFPVIRCAQVETIADIPPRTAELYFGNEFSPGFFAWIVPAGAICRVGLCTSESGAARRLQKFIKRHPTASLKISENFFSFTTGLIPRPTTRKIHGERVLLIGDAAGQNKPLTGGGIYTGLSCARLAAEVAERSLEDEPSGENLSEYERAVDEKFGLEFKLGALARSILEGMSDDDLDEVLEALNKPNVRNLVLDHADFDHHAKLIEAIVKKGPTLSRSLGARSLLRLFRSLF